MKRTSVENRTQKKKKNDQRENVGHNILLPVSSGTEEADSGETEKQDMLKE